MKNTLEKWLDNKFVSALVIGILTMIFIFLFSKIIFIFKPVKALLDTIGIPLIVALILYYLFLPTYRSLIKLTHNRTLATLLILLLIALCITFLLLWMIPFVGKQIASILKELPSYYQHIQNSLANLLHREELRYFQNSFKVQIEQAIASLSSLSAGLVNQAIQSIGSSLGSVVKAGVTLVVFPVFLYYLFKDDYKIKQGLLSIIPTRFHNDVNYFSHQLNEQLSLYIRGQVLVALCVAIMFMVGYSLIGLNYAIVLGILSGFLNIIPFLGSILAAIPALLIGIATSPFMALKVLLVLIIEQTLEGRIISPKVLGDKLDIHPVTILVVLLVSGKMMGMSGVIIGIPLYACGRVLIIYLFKKFKDKSPLYQETIDEMKNPSSH